MELATLRVATALEASGVPNVPLKGPLLARALHGDPGMRQSRDVDVLVERGKLELAAGALGPLGWRREDGPAADPILHVRLVHDDALPDIELHWRVHWYETEFGARALARAQPDPTGVRRLCPVDDLAALMLYHARDGFAGLRHPSDIAAWWDAQEPAPSPLVEPIVRSYPSLTRALVASATLLEGLGGRPCRRSRRASVAPALGSARSGRPRQSPDARLARADHGRGLTGGRPSRAQGSAGGVPSSPRHAQRATAPRLGSGPADRHGPRGALVAPPAAVRARSRPVAAPAAGSGAERTRGVTACRFLAAARGSPIARALIRSTWHVVLVPLGIRADRSMWPCFGISD